MLSYYILYLHSPNGISAAYNNAARQKAVNHIAEYVGASSGTARWYGVPGTGNYFPYRPYGHGGHGHGHRGHGGHGFGGHGHGGFGGHGHGGHGGFGGHGGHGY